MYKKNYKNFELLTSNIKNKGEMNLFKSIQEFKNQSILNKQGRLLKKNLEAGEETSYFKVKYKNDAGRKLKRTSSLKINNCTMGINNKFFFPDAFKYCNFLLCKKKSSKLSNSIKKKLNKFSYLKLLSKSNYLSGAKSEKYLYKNSFHDCSKLVNPIDEKKSLKQIKNFDYKNFTKIPVKINRCSVSNICIKCFEELIDLNQYCSKHVLEAKVETECKTDWDQVFCNLPTIIPHYISPKVQDLVPTSTENTSRVLQKNSLNLKLNKIKEMEMNAFQSKVKNKDTNNNIEKKTFSVNNIKSKPTEIYHTNNTKPNNKLNINLKKPISEKTVKDFNQMKKIVKDNRMKCDSNDTNSNRIENKKIGQIKDCKKGEFERRSVKLNDIPTNCKCGEHCSKMFVNNKEEHENKIRFSTEHLKNNNTMGSLNSRTMSTSTKYSPSSIDKLKNLVERPFEKNDIGNFLPDDTLDRNNSTKYSKSHSILKKEMILDLYTNRTMSLTKIDNYRKPLTKLDFEIYALKIMRKATKQRNGNNVRLEKSANGTKLKKHHKDSIESIELKNCNKNVKTLDQVHNFAGASSRIDCSVKNTKENFVQKSSESNFTAAERDDNHDIKRNGTVFNSQDKNKNGEQYEISVSMDKKNSNLITKDKLINNDFEMLRNNFNIDVQSVPSFKLNKRYQNELKLLNIEENPVPLIPIAKRSTSNIKSTSYMINYGTESYKSLDIDKSNNRSKPKLNLNNLETSTSKFANEIMPNSTLKKEEKDIIENTKERTPSAFNKIIENNASLKYDLRNSLSTQSSTRSLNNSNLERHIEEIKISGSSKSIYKYNFNVIKEGGINLNENNLKKVAINNNNLDTRHKDRVILEENNFKGENIGKDLHMVNEETERKISSKFDTTKNENVKLAAESVKNLVSRGILRQNKISLGSEQNKDLIQKDSYEYVKVVPYTVNKIIDNNAKDKYNVSKPSTTKIINKNSVEEHSEITSSGSLKSICQYNCKRDGTKRDAINLKENNLKTEIVSDIQNEKTITNISTKYNKDKNEVKTKSKISNLEIRSPNNTNEEDLTESSKSIKNFNRDTRKKDIVILEEEDRLFEIIRKQSHMVNEKNESNISSTYDTAKIENKKLSAKSIKNSVSNGILLENKISISSGSEKKNKDLNLNTVKKKSRYLLQKDTVENIKEIPCALNKIIENNASAKFNVNKHLSTKSFNKNGLEGHTELTTSGSLKSVDKYNFKRDVTKTDGINLREKNFKTEKVPNIQNRKSISNTSTNYNKDKTEIKRKSKLNNLEIGKLNNTKEVELSGSSKSINNFNPNTRQKDAVILEENDLIVENIGKKVHKVNVETKSNISSKYDTAKNENVKLSTESVKNLVSRGILRQNKITSGFEKNKEHLNHNATEKNSKDLIQNDSYENIKDVPYALNKIIDNNASGKYNVSKPSTTKVINKNSIEADTEITTSGSLKSIHKYNLKRDVSKTDAINLKKKNLKTEKGSDIQSEKTISNTSKKYNKGKNEVKRKSELSNLEISSSNNTKKENLPEQFKNVNDFNSDTKKKDPVIFKENDFIFENIEELTKITEINTSGKYNAVNNVEIKSKENFNSLECEKNLKKKEDDKIMPQTYTNIGNNLFNESFGNNTSADCDIKRQNKNLLEDSTISLVSSLNIRNIKRKPGITERNDQVMKYFKKKRNPLPKYEYDSSVDEKIKISENCFDSVSKVKESFLKIHSIKIGKEAYLKSTEHFKTKNQPKKDTEVRKENNKIGENTEKEPYMWNDKSEINQSGKISENIKLEVPNSKEIEKYESGINDFNGKANVSVENNLNCEIINIMQSQNINNINKEINNSLGKSPRSSKIVNQFTANNKIFSNNQADSIESTKTKIFKTKNQSLLPNVFQKVFDTKALVKAYKTPLYSQTKENNCVLSKPILNPSKSILHETIINRGVINFYDGKKKDLTNQSLNMKDISSQTSKTYVCSSTKPEAGAWYLKDKLTNGFHSDSSSDSNIEKSEFCDTVYYSDGSRSEYSDNITEEPKSCSLMSIPAFRGCECMRYKYERLHRIAHNLERN